MLSLIKIVNGLLTVAEMLGGLFRDAEQRQAGRDSVGAANAARMVKAREKADAKVKDFDDAIALARSKLRPRADNRD